VRGFSVPVGIRRRALRCFAFQLSFHGPQRAPLLGIDAGEMRIELDQGIDQDRRGGDP
jgi:hypothetical protein